MDSQRDSASEYDKMTQIRRAEKRGNPKQESNANAIWMEYGTVQTSGGRVGGIWTAFINLIL